MKRTSILFSVLLLAFVLTTSIVKANEFTIGSTVENFKLSDINGANKSFNELKGEKGTIVVFLSAQCPVVKLYDDRLNAIVADFKTKGINFIGINSNVTEYTKMDWVKSHAEEKYKFPMLIDKDNIIADKWGASFTPELYLFDKDGKLVYHGAIDNDRSGTNIKATYLRDALTEHLGGKAITTNKTKAFGCTIKRKNMAE
jgi:peroxiredoxin